MNVLLIHLMQICQIFFSTFRNAHLLSVMAKRFAALVSRRQSLRFCPMERSDQCDQIWRYFATLAKHIKNLAKF